MLLHIMHKGEMYDSVNVSMLRCLISSREIIKNKRYDGWVAVDSPLIRNSVMERYHKGLERRLN